MLDETVQRVDYSRKSKGNADVVSGGESQETIDQRMENSPLFSLIRQESVKALLSPFK